MREVIWRGRGGQGAFTASRLLGAAYSSIPANYALAFPSFGPERRGAPMRAFTKLSKAKIGDRSTPAQGDFVVYLDDTLFGEGYEAELKPAGQVLLNSTKAIDDARVRTIDADGISRKVLGRAIPNTALLAALTQMIPGFTRDSLQRAIREYMPTRLHDKNLSVVDEVLRLMDGARGEAPADAGLKGGGL